MSIGNKKILAKNLNHYIYRSGKERKDICNDCGFSYSTFCEWVNGKKYPRIDNIERLANYFHISKSDLIEEPIGTPYNPIVHEIPILGRIAAGLPIMADENIEGYTYTERNGGYNYFALKVQGDSMNAVNIPDGSIIIVRQQPTVENGEIAVVRVNNEEATVKRFRKDGNDVQLIPQSFNPEHGIQFYNIKKTKIEVVGKVVECRTEF